MRHVARAAGSLLRSVSAGIAPERSQARRPRPGRPLPVVEQARIVDLYDGRVGGYFRDPRRDVPHNLYAHTSQLLAEASGASKAHDIGFTTAP